MNVHNILLGKLFSGVRRDMFAHMSLDLMCTLYTMCLYGCAHKMHIYIHKACTHRIYIFICIGLNINESTNSNSNGKF